MARRLTEARGAEAGRVMMYRPIESRFSMYPLLLPPSLPSSLSRQVSERLPAASKEGRNERDPGVSAVVCLPRGERSRIRDRERRALSAAYLANTFAAYPRT